MGRGDPAPSIGRGGLNPARRKGETKWRMRVLFAMDAEEEIMIAGNVACAAHTLFLQAPRNVTGVALIKNVRNITQSFKEGICRLRD